jgi:hypothetical protein
MLFLGPWNAERALWLVWRRTWRGRGEALGAVEGGCLVRRPVDFKEPGAPRVFRDRRGCPGQIKPVSPKEKWPEYICPKLSKLKVFLLDLVRVECHGAGRIHIFKCAVLPVVSLSVMNLTLRVCSVSDPQKIWNTQVIVL